MKAIDQREILYIFQPSFIYECTVKCEMLVLGQVLDLDYKTSKDWHQFNE
jgi:hypothetical protein